MVSCVLDEPLLPFHSVAPGIQKEVGVLVLVLSSVVQGAALSSLVTM